LRDDGTANQQRGTHIDLEHAVPDGKILLMHRLTAGKPADGIQQCVDPSKSLERHRCDVPHVFLIGEIHVPDQQRIGCVHQLWVTLRQTLRRSVHEHAPRAAKSLGDGVPQVAHCTRNNHDLPTIRRHSHSPAIRKTLGILPHSRRSRGSEHAIGGGSRASFGIKPWRG
jgi:hypothetical protein